MYIINPFRKRGMAASDLTSTHPPISERIRILRSMAGASFADYDKSYREVRGTSKVLVPAAAVTAAGAVALRAPQPEAAEKVEEVQRARETSNLMWNLNRYNTITCACGTKLRLPPKFKLPQVRCPHCGKINTV